VIDGMHEIEYRERPRGEKELWALFAGKRVDALKSARNLLVSMREDSKLRSPAVFLNGKRIQWNKKSEEVESQEEAPIVPKGNGALFSVTFRGGPLNGKTLDIKDVPLVITYLHHKYVRPEGDGPYLYTFQEKSS